ncbi:uncharacterized protein LOC135838007 isoform X2 [Planococcus citri]|uniref:uncharacterized protein LOC135838007 isoform X2 n=1 Tax=Planococcus citri TaxID=170843 RepID=UPI0031F77D82
MTEIVVQEQLLECAICIDRLDENCKMLPCQHTYCKTCLEQTFEHEGCLSCPQCRKLVPNITSSDLIDTLPTNLMLLNLIELVKRNPQRPRNEDEELDIAIMNSIKDFQKEKAADVLLKNNEQLQTQLAMESSKRDALLKSAQDMSEEYNQLFISQRSIDEESFIREKRNLLSEKEQLETEVATLKSEQENPDYVADLISWFETSLGEFTQESKKKAAAALKSLRQAKVTQQNGTIQKRIRTLLENLKTPAPKSEIKDGVAGDSSKDDMIEKVNKKFEEVKFLLRNEIHSKELKSKVEKNYLSQPHQLHPPENSKSAHVSHHPYPAQQFHPFPYTPPHLMSIPTSPTRPVGFTPNVNHQPTYQPYYGPYPRHFFPYYPTYAPTTGPFGPMPCPYPGDSQQNHDKPLHHASASFKDKRGRGSHHSAPSADFKKSSNPKFANRNDNLNLSTQSLILPDVRDYDRFEKKMTNLRIDNGGDRLQKSDKKIREKVYQLPTSSKGEVAEPLLMLPDVRHYEKVYSQFPRRRFSVSENVKNDAESFGIRHDGEIKSSKDGNPHKRNRVRSRRGRGKNWNSNSSKSTKDADGFESDSSVNSTTSVSSKLSTCSTPAVFSDKKRFSSPRGTHLEKNRGWRNQNFQRKSRNDVSSKEITNENKSDAVKKVVYPSKEEARALKLDVNKPFASALVCLGKSKIGAEPVSLTVGCLADIYAFEENHSDCTLVAY